MKKLKLCLFIAFVMTTLCGWAYDFQKDGIYYKILSEDDKTVEVTYGDVAYTGDFVIPSEVNGYTVTEIGFKAFTNCAITSVSIPATVTTIGMYAFWGCNDLTSVVIPSKGKIGIESNAFNSCKNLASVTILGEVSQIASGAFYNCTSLKDIYLYARTINDYLYSTAYAYRNVSEEITTHVYKGMEDDYKWSSRRYFPNIVGDLAFKVEDGEVYSDTITQKFVEIEYVRNFENTKWQPLYVPFDINYLDVKDEFEIAKIENVCILSRRIHTNGVIDENKFTLCVSCKLLDKVKNKVAWRNRPYLIKPKKIGTINASLLGQSLIRYKYNYNTDDEWKERIDTSGVTIYPSSEDTISRMIVKDHNVVFKGTYSGVSATDMVANNYLTLKDSKVCVPTEDMEALSPMRWYMSFEDKQSIFGYVMFIIHDTEGNTVDYFESCILSDANTTGISETESQASAISDIFTLDGRKIDGMNLMPGIYIKNGKKYIVK